MLRAMPGPSVSLSRAVAVGIAAVLLALAATSIAYRSSQPSDGTRPGYFAASMSSGGLGVSPILGTETPLVDGDRIVAIEGASFDPPARLGDR